MARIIYSGSSPNGRSVKVHWNSGWQEYIVQFFIKGEYLSLSDYFTSCKDDAIATAQVHLTMNETQKENTNG